MQPRQLLYLFLTFTGLLTLTAVLVLSASGYRLDLSTGQVQGTGIISITSSPNGALVYVNGVPKDATNTSVTGLKPGTYTVSLEKEGYARWEKQVPVKQELVTEVDGLLVPLYPLLRPLTYTGVETPLPSPDGQKIAYTVKHGALAGVWIIYLEDRPFNLSSKPQQVLKDTEALVYSAGTLTWSPDSSQLLIQLTDQNTVFDLTANRSQLLDAVQLEQELADWEAEKLLSHQEKLAALDKTVVDEIAQLQNAVWSPNDSLILHSRINDNGTTDYLIYPVTVTGIESDTLPTPAVPIDRKRVVYSTGSTIPHQIQWFPDSQHLLITEEKITGQTSVEVIELDGGNRMQVFAGFIQNLQVFPNPNGSKIIVLTSFNPDVETYNLYAVHLR